MNFHVGTLFEPKLICVQVLLYKNIGKLWHEDKKDNENYFQLLTPSFKRFMILEIIEEKTILNVPFFLIRSIVNATDNNEKG